MTEDEERTAARLDPRQLELPLPTHPTYRTKINWLWSLTCEHPDFKTFDHQR